MWIDRNTLEISTTAVPEPAAHVEPSLLLRLRNAPPAWAEGSGDLFARFIDNFHSLSEIPKWSEHEADFEFRPLPEDFVLADDPDNGLDDLLEKLVISTPIRWRLEVIELLFDLVE